MRGRLQQRILLASVLGLAVPWVSCKKAASPPTARENSEGFPLVHAEPLPRVIPRRSTPIVLTNSVAPEAVEPETTNHPPTITCGPAQSFPCASADGLQATIAVHVEGPDGKALAVVWNADGLDRYTQQVPAAGPPTTADLTFTYTFTPGDHGIKVTVRDGTFSASCESTVTVQKDAQQPVIACPRDIVVPADPGRCSALVTFDVSATDNCPDLAVSCEPPSGAAFPVGATTVACSATDTAGNTSSCAFNVLVQVSNLCPRGASYWRQSGGAWPVSSLRLGNQVYTRSQITALLHATVPNDASVALAHQLIAACLNTAAGSDPLPICTQLAQAHEMLSTYPGKLPFRVNLGSPEARPMMAVATALSSYNSGLLTPACAPR